MSVAVDLLLAVGVTLELVAVTALLTMRDVYDRLHYAGAATTLGPISIAVAVALNESVSSSGLLALATGLFVFLFGPVSTHVTARVARVLERGSLEPRATERRRT